VVDGEKLLRLVRSTLGGDGPGNLAGLPAMLAEAATGNADPQAQQILGNDPTACVGRRPECVNPGAFAWGVYLSVMCRDVVPFSRTTAVTSGPGDRPFDRIATDELLTAACQAWNVAPADPSVTQPAAAGTPMLIYTGQLDSWSTRPQAEAALATLPGAHSYEVPGQTHNVMGFTDCSITMRNAWLDDPSKPPPDTGCLSALHPVFHGSVAGG
jgi:pimeloyl-ACP methyl ester carboxylesterase